MSRPAQSIASLLDVPESAVQKAVANARTGDIALLAVSGKLASGKDTVAAAVMDALGHADAAHFLYADKLKGEIDDIIAVVRSAATPSEAAGQVSRSCQVSPEAALAVVQMLWSDVFDDLSVHARTRTPGVRAALQYWGSDVRRATDPDYWVRLSLRDAVHAAAEGKSIYYTDCRFPNEVVWAQRAGFFVARISVTAATQRARLDARDGLPPDPSALTHVSETALDQFVGFDAVVDNNGPLEVTVKELSEAMRASRQVALPAPARPRVGMGLSLHNW